MAAMIATLDKHSGKSCIIDCGTAVTMDAVDSDGVHQGGVILPGSQLMQKALMSHTKIEVGKIEAGNNDGDYNVFSNTTEMAIHSGCISAVAGGIDFVFNQMTSQGGSFDQVIMTGGGAEKMKQYLSNSSFSSLLSMDEYLVLDGLRLVAESI